jgi:hypothetical protein
MRSFALTMIMWGISATAYSVVPSANFIPASDEYETLAEIQVSIPRGRSQLNHTFESIQEPASISVWHETRPSCRGFNVLGGRAKEGAENAEWRTMVLTNYQGIGHLSTSDVFQTVQIQFENLLRPQNCRIYIRKAKFALPQVRTLLAKVRAPVCEANDDPATEPDCVYGVDRIDGNIEEGFLITQEDFLNFGLKAGDVFKLTGYVKILDDQAEYFKIETASRVQ